MSRPLRIVVLCPHFAPDVAPTGVVITRLVEELAARGHHLDVVTSLPWYRHHRVEEGWAGRLVHRECTSWGTITRLHPLTRADKRNLAARAVSFVLFTLVATAAAAAGRRADIVLAMSPPLTLGPGGWIAALARRARLVLNVQDVFPDVAIEVGALRGERLIGLARWLERFTYRRCGAVVVLSEDLAENVRPRAGDPGRVRVIPNFVDTGAIVPGDRATPYRAELGAGDRVVVMYAGNLGYSQPVELVVEAARRLRHRDDVVFVVNGGGSARPALEALAAGLPNVVFRDLQPAERLGEVLATGDIHVIPLRAGLARSSVPSKTYSILAAGRPILAAVDPGSEVERVLRAASAGIAVPPDDPEEFTAALEVMLTARAQRERMGRSGRTYVESWWSPEAVAEGYERLFLELLR